LSRRWAGPAGNQQNVGNTINSNANGGISLVYSG
jgi:hypothetical protein